MVRSNSPIDLEIAGWVVLRSAAAFVHAAGLRDNHQDMKVVQLHPASDAITQQHLGTYCGNDISLSEDSISGA
jgi:hypothetical protein